MSSLRDVILGQIQMGQMLFEMFIEDFSDEEYFRPPFAGANHAAWIFGHIARTEDWAVALIMGTKQRIPAAMHELFDGEACDADTSKYPTRKEIDELYRNSRGNLLEVLGSFDESRWDEPSPDGAPKKFFPTIGSIWGMQATHQFWHIGQLTVCRKAFGKKKVFG